MTGAIVTVFPGSSRQFVGRVIERDNRRVLVERLDTRQSGWYWRDQVSLPRDANRREIQPWR